MEGNSKSSYLFHKLPKSIEHRSRKIIGLTPLNSRCSNYEQLKTWVDKFIPTSDKDEIDEELRKSFLLGDRKSLIRPHKSLSKIAHPKKLTPRGKKRMTALEKRNCGLLQLNKKNKTFDMFIPIYKIWQNYADELLGIKHYISSGWTGCYNDKKTETIQTRLKKIEYYGSLLKVTKSRCSSYVGVEGFVIQETKNTFSIINQDSKVKTIPKLHSEFSLIVGGMGFTVLGNHLHQRPVDRAKQTFKKHCLWL